MLPVSMDVYFSREGGSRSWFDAQEDLGTPRQDMGYSSKMFSFSGELPPSFEKPFLLKAWGRGCMSYC